MSPPGDDASSRADHPARIRFSLPEGPAALPRLGEETTAEWTEHRCTIRTAYLQRTLYALLSWTGEHGVELELLGGTRFSHLAFSSPGKAL